MGVGLSGVRLMMGGVRVMWISRALKTYLKLTADCRDPECLKTGFTLLRSVSVVDVRGVEVGLGAHARRRVGGRGRDT